jgi:hypothetical protein
VPSLTRPTGRADDRGVPDRVTVVGDRELPGGAAGRRVDPDGSRGTHDPHAVADGDG